MITCGAVPVLDNGKVSVGPIHTEVGAVAIYECENGYKFKDNRNSRTCQNDKTWSNDDLECREFFFCGHVYSNIRLFACQHLSLYHYIHTLAVFEAQTAKYYLLSYRL